MVGDRGGGFGAFLEVAGLAAGETIAVQNTFTLKAEVEKDEAEHGHD